MVRLPRILPLSRLNGATPTRAATCRRVSEPSSGSCASNVRALTGSNARHRAEQLLLGAPHRAVPDRPVEVALELGQGFFQPAEVGVDPLVQGGFGGLTPVALGHQHLEQLPTASYKSPQMAGRLIRQGTYRRPDRLGEMSDHLGIQT